MLNWSIRPLELQLKFLWEIARGSAKTKTNFIVTVQEGDTIGEGEMAGLTGHPLSFDLIQKEFASLPLQKVTSPELCEDLQVEPSLLFAISSALTHLRCQQEGKSLSAYLGLRAVPRRPTSFSIPLMPLEKIAGFVKEHRVNEYPACKVKVGPKHLANHVKEVAKWYAGPLRIDANASFSSAQDVIAFFNEIRELPVEFVEQPLAVDNVKDSEIVKTSSQWPIVADESLQRGTDVKQLEAAFHGINVKLMKSGSYLKAIEQLRVAQTLGMKTMLGCMVETLLGIDGAHALSADVDWIDLDGNLFLENDPYIAR